ncbi:MAG: hypothetical protein LIP02_07115 [Bacteroidales bacterium]|nr:hypothetical protein [Bacteroidales bacterium]
MRKLIFAMMAVAVAALTARAESTIYVFMQAPPQCDTHLWVNGVDTGSLAGPVKTHHKENKAANLPAWDEMQETVKKVVVNSDGLTPVVAKGEWDHFITGQHVNFLLETSIEVEDGQTYYLKANNDHFDKIKAKDGEKLLKKGDYYVLPDYVVE